MKLFLPALAYIAVGGRGGCTGYCGGYPPDTPPCTLDPTFVLLDDGKGGAVVGGAIPAGGIGAVDGIGGGGF